MRILFSIHLFPPTHCCGSEMYTVKMIHELQKRGHKCRVYLHQWYDNIPGITYTYRGIEVITCQAANSAKDELFNWADVVFTHLDFAKWTVWKTRQIKKPCFFMVHNTSDYYNEMIKANPHTRIIYNAEHAKEHLKYDRPGFVLPPQIDPERVLAKENKREFITLINLCDNKGVKQFYEIAKSMPDRKFLGVKGSYMEQDLNCPKNVTIWEKQVDISRVYAVTKVLLMPSDYESFGMTASEALANGIPVICSPTPGLKENCKEAAQYLDRDNIKKWVSLLRKLESPKEYEKWSNLGLQRTIERNPDELYNQLNTFISEHRLF